MSAAGPILPQVSNLVNDIRYIRAAGLRIPRDRASWMAQCVIGTRLRARVAVPGTRRVACTSGGAALLLVATVGIANRPTGAGVSDQSLPMRRRQSRSRMGTRERASRIVRSRRRGHISSLAGHVRSIGEGSDAGCDAGCRCRPRARDGHPTEISRPSLARISVSGRLEHRARRSAAATEEVAAASSPHTHAGSPARGPRASGTIRRCSPSTRRAP
jgi:hypothetical protein